MMPANPRLARRMVRLLGERAPVPAMLAVGTALTCAAAYVSGGTASLGSAALGGGCVAAVLIQLRLMDEVKDFAKDQLAHPHRPLPRGLVSVAELRGVIRVLGASMAAFALIITAFVNGPAGAFYAATIAYAYLMYHEFYAPRALARNAFAYALAHQVLVVPLCLFAAALATRSPALPPRTYWFAVACLGASFTFELARKLDVRAHPALGTYLQRHGRTATLIALLAALSAFAFGAFSADLAVVLWPFLAIVVFALGVAQLRPSRHQWAARAAALLVLALILAPTIQRVLEMKP
jgi:4-hydroxybenzoate polyprenyltransferase